MHLNIPAFILLIFCYVFIFTGLGISCAHAGHWFGNHFPDLLRLGYTALSFMISIKEQTKNLETMTNGEHTWTQKYVQIPVKCQSIWMLLVLLNKIRVIIGLIMSCCNYFLILFRLFVLFIQQKFSTRVHVQFSLAKVQARSVCI